MRDGGDLDGPSPREAPATYPGVWPGGPTLVGTQRSEPVHGSPRAGWLDGAGRLLDERLAAVGAAALADRRAVVAVGSNANPAQLRHKFDGAGVSTVVVLVPAEVDGLAVGCLPYVCAVGYVPAAPVARPGVRTRLVVGLFDDDQLAALDATEGGYRRVVLDPHVHAVRVDGVDLASVGVYGSTSGLLADREGTPADLAPQAVLWAGLVAAVPALAEVLGADIDEAARTARTDPGRRRRAATLVSDAGLTVADGPWGPVAADAPLRPSVGGRAARGVGRTADSGRGGGGRDPCALLRPLRARPPERLRAG